MNDYNSKSFNYSPDIVLGQSPQIFKEKVPAMINRDYVENTMQ